MSYPTLQSNKSNPVSFQSCTLCLAVSYIYTVFEKYSRLVPEGFSKSEILAYIHFDVVNIAFWKKKNQVF